MPVQRWSQCVLFVIPAETDSVTDEKIPIITDKVLAYLRSPWMTKFLPSVHTVVFLLSLPFNIIAILIFLFRVKVKTPSVVFMLNLAVADVLFVLVLPFDVVYRFSGNNWLIGEGMCRLATAAFTGNMYCSILLTTSISVDRFLVVVYPMRSLLWRTVERAWVVCLVIWAVSMASMVPLFISKLTVSIDQLNITVCFDLLEHNSVKGFYFYYFIACISVFFLLPFVITTFCYAATIRSLSSPKIESTFKKSRSVILCITVLSEFIICFGDKPLGEALFFAYILSMSISSVSCCLDPVIYYYGSTKCKKHVYSLVCCGKTKADCQWAESTSRTAGWRTSALTV